MPKPRKPARGIMPGDKVKHYGTVGAIVLTGGERYLMMHKGGVVSFMPAADCERIRGGKQ